jgi:hypothetical protein
MTKKYGWNETYGHCLKKTQSNTVITNNLSFFTPIPKIKENFATHVFNLWKVDKQKTYQLVQRFSEKITESVPANYSSLDYLFESFVSYIRYSRMYLQRIYHFRNNMYCPDNRTILNEIFNKITHIVDLGCGCGYSTQGLQEIFPAANVIGTNLPGYQTDFATTLGVKVVTNDNLLVGKNSSVLTFASEYFEHFKEPITHLQEIIEKLHPKIMLVANSFSSHAIGHFDYYTIDKQQYSKDTVARLFSKEMRSLGYKFIEVGFYNRRPHIYLLYQGEKLIKNKYQGRDY